ncbi:MAG: hypothetical protein JSS20_15965, partial [Proteobacteria bacterium]|nr:hypothetical protein [Pseudomonadota bacterium]
FIEVADELHEEMQIEVDGMEACVPIELDPSSLAAMKRYRRLVDAYEVARRLIVNDDRGV